MAPSDTSTIQETEIAAAWVLRRVGFGSTTDDLDRAVEIGLAAFLDELFEPDTFGIPDDGDPWRDIDLSLRTESRSDIADLIVGWLDRMQNHSRPVAEWLSWYWHGHLVTSISVVKSPSGMANQIGKFRNLGGGSFKSLLREITIDPAMLRYLDGNRNTGRAPNENYSRELLELFALGVGNYTEADVLAGAKALSGWTQQRNNPAEVQFIARRHDDTPQRYLGVDGVHDLDTVIDAVTSHEACAEFITRSLGETILGPQAIAPYLAEVAQDFAADGLKILPLVRRLVEIGLTGQTDELAISPVPWIMGALRATDTKLPFRHLADLVRGAGQVPMSPPNVSGWPSGDAWFSTSATAARLQAASAIADAAPTTAAPVVAAESRDLNKLARSLGRPQGFTSTTADALLESGTSGRTLLALALSTPEMVIS